jgi:hypothetical protein
MFCPVDDDAGGTELTPTDVGVPKEYGSEVVAGWVSVLVVLKAPFDFS